MSIPLSKFGSLGALCKSRRARGRGNALDMAMCSAGFNSFSSLSTVGSGVRKLLSISKAPNSTFAYFIRRNSILVIIHDIFEMVQTR